MHISAAMSEYESDSIFKKTPSNLLKCLEAICGDYRKKIDLSMHNTHEELPAIDTGIPIGLCSSPLLANWYLRPFDKEIKAKLRPAYYGRYVDDLLLVVEVQDDPALSSQPIADFINDALVDRELLHPPVNNRYEIINPGGLHLQQSKCILQYFDVGHSIAGLEKFQKKLEENSSEFLLLPVDEMDSSLEDVAYELMYEGSVNKFRSVKGLAENRYELAKNIARQTILHLLTDDPPNAEVSVGLRKFFKGRNAILFHDLWERVFTYFVIANDTKSAGMLDRSLRAEIKRLRAKRKVGITEALRLNLESHLLLSRAMASALVIEDYLDLDDVEENTSLSIKRANLVRHHFVRLPLLNYTDYQGALTSRDLKDKVSISSEKLQWSPRYVNFDECLLLAQTGSISIEHSDNFKWACEIFNSVNRHFISGVECTTVSGGHEVDNV